MVFATEDIVAVNFVGRIAAANSPASASATTVAECAAVATNLVGCVAVAENFAAIAVAMKWSTVDCVVDRVEAANFVAGVDAVTDVVDRVVGVANCVVGAAAETNADKVARVVNSVADVAVTSVAEYVVQTVNVALVLAWDVVAIAIAFENVDAAVDIVDTVNTESCSAIRVTFRGG